MSTNNGEEPGDDQQKLGLGFQSMGLAKDYEARYEKMLIEEIGGLVLGEHRLERERGEFKEGFVVDSDKRGYKGDDQQKLGLGFESMCSDEDEEAGYEKKLIEEIEGLVYREHRLEREKVGEIEEGFGVDDNRRGYKGNFSYPVRPEEGFIEDGDVGFNGGKNSGGYNGNFSYPLRPDAEDCQHYLRVGLCKFGSSCKFNHPLKRRTLHPKPAKDKEDYSERPANTECKCYMAFGGCKHGNSCRFRHIRAIVPTTRAAEFNILGLPIRPGETECLFYMRNGSCKYGSSCKFNHPDPISVRLNASPKYSNGGNVSLHAPPQTNMPLWSSHNLVPVPTPELNNYQAPEYPETEKKLPTPPALMLNNPTETNFYLDYKPPMLVSEFPERPGEPVCNYFMKTGDCNYGSGCKFHHPKNRMRKSAPFALSDKGLPLRPGEQACSYYTRYGLCKYGPACRYDHSTHHANSASSSVPDETNLLSLKLNNSSWE